MSELPAALFLPLEHLLLRGGDSRLTVSGPERVNVYGCRVGPWPDQTSFASSTASTISQQAFLQAERARQTLIDAALTSGVTCAFDDRLEQMRKALSALLQIPADAEIVFAPSGTDAQLAALFAVRAVLGKPLTSIILGADETGSGTAFTSRGLHFATCTALNASVEKGSAIAGLAEGVESVAIAMKDGLGQLHALDLIDAHVERAVAQAVADGRHVLLQAMDRSKFGWRAPSQACLARIARQWPNDVQIVVDACQARLSTSRLASYVEQGYVVLLTGSKFFGGPPFSGAVIVPAQLARAVGQSRVPLGLDDYFTGADWPLAWRKLRAQFHSSANLGAWLRWEAALCEMHAYFAVPQRIRHHILKTFGDAIAICIARSPSLELLADQQPDPSDRHDDEEFSERTIFSFYLRKGGRTLSVEECGTVYRALQRDLAADLPTGATAEAQRLAQRHCHIGQPVALPNPSGAPSAALRISASARLVSECFRLDRGEMQKRLDQRIADAGAAVAKIELILTHLIR